MAPGPATKCRMRAGLPERGPRRVSLALVGITRLRYQGRYHLAQCGVEPLGSFEHREVSDVLEHDRGREPSRRSCRPSPFLGRARRPRAGPDPAGGRRRAGTPRRSRRLPGRAPAVRPRAPPRRPSSSRSGLLGGMRCHCAAREHRRQAAQENAREIGVHHRELGLGGQAGGLAGISFREGCRSCGAIRRQHPRVDRTRTWRATSSQCVSASWATTPASCTGRVSMAAGIVSIPGRSAGCGLARRPPDRRTGIWSNGMTPDHRLK